MNKLNFIDLFAGCGGLSEGFYRQGFRALAHVEYNHWACETLRTRMKHYGYDDWNESVLEVDITRDDILTLLEKSVSGKTVDIIIGGPPCQSFSSLGRAKDENGMNDDPRNYLFESYVKVLNHFLPKVFVFENVTGILNAEPNGVKIIDAILVALSENYDVALRVLNSANYGVPQVRKRVIIIGVRKDLDFSADAVHNALKYTHYDPDMNETDRLGLLPFVTVRDAIGDLPPIQQGEGAKVISYTPDLNKPYLQKICNINQTALLDHVARHHNPMDVQRYRAMSENCWTFQELLENRPDLRHEKARVFGNSYTVQFWDFPSKTIIAHLYKDGNQFIHPDPNQARTFTVREAARIQSFPDDFIFEGSRTEQYKQIGNAVPPLFAEAIAKGVKRFLRGTK